MNTLVQYSIHGTCRGIYCVARVSHVRISLSHLPQILLYLLTFNMLLHERNRVLWVYILIVLSEFLGYLVEYLLHRQLLGRHISRLIFNRYNVYWYVHAG